VREATLAPRLDEFMADVLRPLLSQWLDANLERIVDQAVRDEIAKFTRSLRP
jgi:cell pole-organizing protein PopZ